MVHTKKSTLGISIFKDGIHISYANAAKYFGMTLDVKLHWNEHVKINMSIYNKLLIYEYNQILQPIWTYGAQLWKCTSEKI